MPLLTAPRRRASCFFATLLALACSSPATAGDTGGFVTRFDQSIATGLPASLDLPADGARARSRGSRTLLVSRQLNVRVDFPDESTPGRMFVGTLDGESVTMTRSGDHLDVTLARRDGVTLLGFSDGSDAMEHEVLLDNGRRDDVGDDVVTPMPGRPRRSLLPDHVEDPLAYDLHFHVFLHDDTRPLQPRHLHAQYLAWWMAEMSEKILPSESMRLSYYTRVGWLTDMAYGYERSLDNWEQAVSLYAEAAGLAFDKTYKHKFMLVTRDQPAPGLSGQAFQDGNVATASLSGRYAIVAHEFGHTLGATHEHAELAWTNLLWICATHMIALKEPLQANCYRYSDANGRNIRSYMRHGPNRSLPVDGPVPEWEPEIESDLTPAG